MQVYVIDATGRFPGKARSIKVRNILILDVQQIKDLDPEIHRVPPITQQHTEDGR